MSTLIDKANEILQDKERNLLSRNLVSGITCLGVTGSATFDYSLIGTSVSVQATTGIPKGGRWKGVKTSQSEVVVSKTIIGTSMPSMTSVDGIVGYESKGFTSETTTDYIKFFNTKSITYENYPVDMSDIIPQLELTSGNTYYPQVVQVNFDGTLVYIYLGGTDTSKQKIITIEIDRESKTGKAYLTSVEEQINKYDMFLINDYLFRKNNASKGVLYRYNWDLHLFELLSNDNDFNAFYTDYHTALRSSYAILDDTTFLVAISGANWTPAKVVKIVVNIITGTFTTLVATVPDISSSYKPSIFISPDGNYIGATVRMGGSTYRTNYYALNNQDMTVTLLVENFTGTDDQTFAYTSDGYILTSHGVYRYDGTTCTKVSDFSYSYIKSSTTPVFNIHKFFLAYSKDSGSLIGSVSSQGSDYLISYDNTSNIEPDYAYGIANESMNIGDVGTAQLLWSTYSQSE